MLTPVIWPTNVTNSKNRKLGISTDSHVVRGISLSDMARYKLIWFVHEDANIGCCCFSPCSFLTLRMLYIGSYKPLKSVRGARVFPCQRELWWEQGKNRIREVINKTCAYYVGLTPRLLCLHRTQTPPSFIVRKPYFTGLSTVNCAHKGMGKCTWITFRIP